MNIFKIFSVSACVALLIGCASTVKTSADSGPKTAAEKGKIQLSVADKKAIGQQIWKNECAGTVSGLTSWNQGEDFPSLGIGHFIWYIKERPGPFDESFPPMLNYLQRNGVPVPAWLLELDGCPWKTRQEFLDQQQSPRMIELRNFLASTVDHQTGFIVERLENSLPKMKAATPNPADKERLERNFYAVAGSRAGVYALIDYVNFKGEGIKPSEAYKGQGWGLQDVLLLMQPADGPANHQFAEAAKRALTRRVQNSPPERNEVRWLNGWKVRCDGYKKGI